MTRLFISYRRADTESVSGRLYDHISIGFGRENVFKDVDSIALGDDFRKAITDAVRSCDAFLAIIGADWLTACDAHGSRRLDDPDDFVRIELETAINHEIPIIPVLVNGCTMPVPAELPESILPIVYHNAAVIRPDPDFVRDVARLSDALSKIVGASEQQTNRLQTIIESLTRRLIIARSNRELRSVLYEVEEELSESPHDPKLRMLHDDIERALGGGPIMARPPSFAYRLMRLIRQRPIRTVLVLVLFTLAIVSISYLVSQWW